MNANQIVNTFLGGQRISKPAYDDLKIVAEEIKPLEQERQTKILNWFQWWQNQEIVGWRSKVMTQKITKILTDNNQNNPIQWYALFCPSYKKGKGAYGFRTDDVGNTTKKGIENSHTIWSKTKELGFSCQPPLAIYFDLAIEQSDRVLASPKGLQGLSQNVDNLVHNLPTEFIFMRLSELNPELLDTVGYTGIKQDPLPIPDDIFNRIVERGRKFYELFDWTEDQILERSKIIATSEALVGNWLREQYPSGVMVYTPTMLERGAVYSGTRFNTDPLPIVFPKK